MQTLEPVEVCVARINQQLWDETVALYEAADTEAFAAYLACDDFPNNSDEQRQAEERHETLRARADELEDMLLSNDAPNPAAARYQLKVFALRELSIDLDDEPCESELGGPTFRRIYAALSLDAGGELRIV